MDSLTLFYVVFLMMAGLLGIAFFVPQFGNLFFLVPLPFWNQEAAALASRFRTQALDASIFLFMLIYLSELLLPSLFFLSAGVSLWLFVFGFLYYDSHQKVLRLKQSLSATKKEPEKALAVPGFSLHLRHCLLPLFFLVHPFFLTFHQLKHSPVPLPLRIWILPVTALFLLGLVLFAALLIRQAPPLATVGIKKRFLGVLYGGSLWVSLLFLAGQWLLFVTPSPAFLAIALTLPLLIFYGNLLFFFQTKKENRPYGFFVSHPDKGISSSSFLTTSADGTRIYLNPAHSKTRLVWAGLALYFLAYGIFTAFLLTG